MRNLVIVNIVIAAICWIVGWYELMAVIGVLTGLLGWMIIGYIAHRNQVAAKDSDLVDDTNFGPRWAAVVETALHPDHAANWWRPMPVGWRPPEHYRSGKDFIKYEEKTLSDDGTQYVTMPRYFIKVFPAISQDSSEQFGIRPDDNITT